jgi:hypothetical protein
MHGAVSNSVKVQIYLSLFVYAARVIRTRKCASINSRPNLMGETVSELSIILIEYGNSMHYY